MPDDKVFPAILYAIRYILLIYGLFIIFDNITHPIALLSSYDTPATATVYFTTTTVNPVYLSSYSFYNIYTLNLYLIIAYSTFSTWLLSLFIDRTTTKILRIVSIPVFYFTFHTFIYDIHAFPLLTIYEPFSVQITDTLTYIIIGMILASTCSLPSNPKSTDFS